MIDVTETIKKAYDISTTQVDKIILNGEEYRITNVEFYDDTYQDGNIFGTAIGKAIDFEIDASVDLEGQEVEYQTGIILNGVIQWISLGKFIVQSVEPNDTTIINKVTAMDYMLKTNILYESKLNYSDGTVTLVDVLQEACNNSELELATLEFPNSTFIVDSNQFAEGTLNRQVIQAVAQISGTVAKIRNNKLYLINPNSITEISKVFTLNNYKEAEIKRKTHPINLVSLAMKDIEGENITLRDEESIVKDGENSLVINDNPFAYTQAKREQLITALFDAVKGFEYKAYSFKCQGLPYLETLDKVQFKDKAGNTYDSFIFRFNYKSPKGLESTIEAPSIIKATVNYQNVPSALDIAKRTEIIVDKQNQKIQSVVEQTDAQNQKIAVVEQTVGELNSKISDIADITTSKESTNARIDFEGINQSEPIYIHIHPIGENISYLYPHSKLFPSDTLFLKNRKLRFTNTTTNEVWDYELPANLLIYNSENYDEFILDYDSQTVMINKRCGYNADGTVKLLDAMTTYSYDFPKIELTDGDYKVELLGYNNAYMLVRLMAQNIYTTQFATKAEMKSEIKQTAEEVDTSVDKKLENYSTTTQMHSAINVKANQITESVEKTFATKDALETEKSERIQTASEINQIVSKKVGNDEVISKINQSAETVGIKANKVELSVNDILNLLAGNTINLTSKNITISSTNFSVDKNGKATMKDVSILGGNIDMVGDSSTPTIRIRDYSGDVIELYPSNFYMAYDYPPANAKVYQFLQKKGYYVECLGSSTSVNYDGIITPTVTQTSLEELKKNFEKLDNEKALEIILNTDIYKYHLKSQEDTEKKHIGFVIGDKYKYSEDITSNKNDGVDNYSMTSASYGAIQKLYEIIQEQQKKIEELEKITKGE